MEKRPTLINNYKTRIDIYWSMKICNTFLNFIWCTVQNNEKGCGICTFAVREGLFLLISDATDILCLVANLIHPFRTEYWTQSFAPFELNKVLFHFIRKKKWRVHKPVVFKSVKKLVPFIGFKKMSHLYMPFSKFKKFVVIVDLEQLLD